jgi:hypothetical protein
MQERASSTGVGRASRARLGAVFAAALVAVVVAGLAGGLVRALAVTAPPSPSPTGTTVLKVGWVDEPDNLNPFIGTSTSSFLIFHLNYDMLTGYKASNVDPAPELATSWSHSPDGDNIGKLLAGYLGAIGIDVKFQYMDEGAMNIDSYLYVHPRGGATTAKSSGPLITFLVTAAIAIVLIVVALVMRRR